MRFRVDREQSLRWPSGIRYRRQTSQAHSLSCHFVRMSRCQIFTLNKHPPKYNQTSSSFSPSPTSPLPDDQRRRWRSDEGSIFRAAQYLHVSFMDLVPSKFGAAIYGQILENGVMFARRECYQQIPPDREDYLLSPRHTVHRAKSFPHPWNCFTCLC